VKTDRNDQPNQFGSLRQNGRVMALSDRSRYGHAPHARVLHRRSSRKLRDDVPECDLVLIAGDISAHTREDNERFLRRDFPNWLERQPAKEIVGIAGNHDFVAKQWPSIFRSLPWHYLENEVAEISGLKIAGSAWTPRFGFSAFMAEDDGAG
jgi:predicted phosphohydrolase